MYQYIISIESLTQNVKEIVYQIWVFISCLKTLNISQKNALSRNPTSCGILATNKTVLQCPTTLFLEVTTEEKTSALVCSAIKLSTFNSQLDPTPIDGLYLW